MFHKLQAHHYKLQSARIVDMFIDIVVLVIEVVCYAVWCVGSFYWGEGVCYATLSVVWAEDSCSHASRVIASWRLGTDKVIRGIEASDGFTAGNMAAAHPQFAGSVANNDTRLLLFMRERKTTRKQIKTITSYSIPTVQNYCTYIYRGFYRLLFTSVEVR